MVDTALLNYKEESTNKVVPYRGTSKEIPLLYPIAKKDLSNFIDHVKEAKELIYGCKKVGLIQDGKEYSFEDLSYLEGKVMVFAEAIPIEHEKGVSRFDTIIKRRVSWTDADDCARETTRDLIHLLKGKF